MILYKHLMLVAGLSHREAAAFHDVRLDTIRSWSINRNPAPEGVINELTELIDRMLTAVDQAMSAIEDQHTSPTVIELGSCSDDKEAQDLGWPCASVHHHVIGLIAAQCLHLGHTVEVVPRGSTIASAAAIEAHE